MKRLLGALVLLLGALFAIQRTARSAPPVPGWPVVRGSIGGEPAIWHVALQRGEGVDLCPLQRVDFPSCRRLDGLPLAEVRTMAPNSWAQHSTFWLAERLEGTVPPEVNAHALALAARLEGSRARLARDGFEPTVEAAIVSLLDGGVT